MAKRLSELGVKVDDGKVIYDCQQVSITDILNCEIKVLEFQTINTKHGDGRFLVHYSTTDDREEGKFFTNSQSLKSALSQISKDDLPFITVIKATKCGKGKLYQFT